jgi:FAD/FMN-containing dehydrogenase
MTGLRRGFEGAIILPDEEGYDEARLVWNAMVDRRPAIVARCANASDVIRAIRFARAQDLEIGVRCGGHSVLGLCVPDGGLMIDLTPMRSVRVDPDARRAWVQGGALLGELDRATQPFGLATTAGNVSDTGVGGLTLGGGMGWLARRCGLACDNVARFEIVTADGEIGHASESENADLYWALRGGGGNFGVVIEFEFRLHDVGTTALLVDRFYELDEAPTVVARWRAAIDDAPRQATLNAWVGDAGPWRFLPRESWGRPMASVGYVWVGDPEVGRRFRSFLGDRPRPIAERVEELSYLQLQTMDDERQREPMRRYWKGHYLSEFGGDAIEAFLSRGANGGTSSDGPLAYAALQSYRGAIAEVGNEESAFGHREALAEFVAVAYWSDAAEDETRMTAARRYGAAIEPFASGVYVNDLADEGDDGIRRAYGADKLARLTALKDRYDPENVFHLNHNIRPSAMASG